MSVGPVPSNAINIPLLRTGCCDYSFDSNYPIQLNGIIAQDEFEQSIKNINQTISLRKLIIIFGLIILLVLLAAIGLFVAGGIIAVNSRTHDFPVLVAIGLGLFGLGIVLLFIGACYIPLRRATLVRQAIAEESMKYTTRSPIPCGWRLNAFNTWARTSRNRRAASVVYVLIIDIGRSADGNEPFQFNQNNMPSAPYSGQSTAGVCSQCGMPRQNYSTKFCPSCGQPFNSY